ncbi:MAG: DUF4358 domain-containing protein [Lachnospiraceae bacterium]|nr:DUF4358 domain-containing protein [Lachnospiraceae bacterium]
MKKSLTAVMAAVCLLFGCGRVDAEKEEPGYRDDVSAQALVEAVAQDLADEYWPDSTLAPEFLEDWYGISDEMYEEYYGQTPMISANVDTLIVVKAREDHLNEVEQALTAYRESVIKDTFQYPMNIPKIQASQIRTFGKYVCFVQLGGFMEGIEDDEEAAIEVCRKMNEQALSVMEGELTR